MGLVEWYTEEATSVCQEIDNAKSLSEKERLQLKIAALSQVGKGITQQISLLGLGMKYGKKAQAMIYKKRLMDETLVLSQPRDAIEEEKVYCEDQNLEITRRECLRRSGSNEHFDQCRQCEVDKNTRRLLISEALPGSEDF